MSLDPQIVVTGAAGFIGGRLLEAFSRQTAPGSVLAVDHPLRPGRPSPGEQVPGTPFLEHIEFLRRLEAGELRPEVILHMGACSSTTETSWPYLEENNLGYSRRIWSWCARHQKRVIYASSAATYGDGSAGFDDEGDLHRLQPLNLYGRSKHDFDLWVEAECRAGGPTPAQSVGLKFFNVFGYGESHKGRMASMVYHGYRQIHESGVVRLFQSHRDGYADGGQLRDFISVEDVVTVIRRLESAPGVSGLFNLGTGRAQSFRSLLEAVFLALGREPRIEYIPMPADLQGRYQYFTEATMRKLASAGIEYSPTPLPEAVRCYVARMEADAGR